MAKKEKLGWYDRARFLFSTEPFSITDTLIRRTLSIQAQQQMALAAIGLSRYRLQEGRLPRELTALAPGYLKVLPRDMMDGKPLRYRLLPEGGVALYSVGYDGRDNRGSPALLADKKDYRQIWDGQDALWPAAATAEEATRFQK